MQALFFPPYVESPPNNTEKGGRPNWLQIYPLQHSHSLGVSQDSLTPHTGELTFHIKKGHIYAVLGSKISAICSLIYPEKEFASASIKAPPTLHFIQPLTCFCWEGLCILPKWKEAILTKSLFHLCVYTCLLAVVATSDRGVIFFFFLKPYNIYTNKI